MMGLDSGTSHYTARHVTTRAPHVGPRAVDLV